MKKVKPFLERMNYIYLFKYTQKGAEQLSMSPTRVAKANNFVKNDLHTLCRFISLSGEYDMMTFFEGTADEAYQLLLYLKAQGIVEVIMLRVETRSLEQYTGLLNQTFRGSKKTSRA